VHELLCGTETTECWVTFRLYATARRFITAFALPETIQLHPIQGMPSQHLTDLPNVTVASAALSPYGFPNQIVCA